MLRVPQRSTARLCAYGVGNIFTIESIAGKRTPQPKTEKGAVRADRRVGFPWNKQESLLLSELLRMSSHVTSVLRIRTFLR